MRKSFACAIVCAVLAAPGGHAAQDTQEPAQTFRSGVDLITVDVVAVDGQGRPVEDLRARDFTVKVDGRVRPAVSAVRVNAGGGAAPLPAADSAGAPISTNTTAANARRIVIAVDQSQIRPAAITPLLGAASRFVDGLTPQDHAAFVAFPEPGPRVDFTTDRARVRQAMQGIVGQPPKNVTRVFGLSLTESLSIDQKERTFVELGGTFDQIWPTLGPNTRRVLERGCRGLMLEELALMENLGAFKQCIRDLGNDAMMNALDVRTEANVSLRRLESFLTELVPIEGSKSMVLISAGLVIEDLTLLDEVVRLAAAARTSITVIAVEPEREREILDLPNSQSPTTLQDRQLEMTGLETVADRTGGALYRAVGNGTGIFDRVASELSSWYVVAVERRTGDPERQRVEVEVRRRGVTVRSNRTFAVTPGVSASRSREDVLRDALSSPIAIPGVPLRVSTFARRDATSGQHRLHIAAQVGQPGAPAADFSVGYVVFDDANRAVASQGRRVTLMPAGGSSNEPLHFDTAVALDAGAYSVRVAVVDAEGLRGSVVHRVELGGPSSGFSTSDLIVGVLPPDGEVMHPSVEPHVSGHLAGYLELYPDDLDPGALSVSLEIAEGEASPALAAQPLTIREGPQPSWRVAMGVVGAPMAPGRYVARARILRGDTTVRMVSRPFVLEREERSSTAPPPRTRGAPVSSELRQRTASYVRSVVGALANVVAREELMLTGPDRRVTSDLLLVQYPGSTRDLLVYRDVSHLDGEPLADRQDRLTALFLKPVAGLRERATQIVLAGERYVPSVLNPLFVLAFMHEDFQPRFELTVRDAGAEWPREVTGVAFEETGRPTLLRAGPFGTFDVPTRGTAWIEEATGRILQTELRIGTTRSAPTVTTRFALDERLQIMVPVQMRTENPDGIATYSDFRRFNVRTDTAVSPDPRE